VHISAPHIYGSALEALELQPDSSMSFLNIGSGTGYLSCIVSSILGPKSLNYGIELNEEAIVHCNKAITNCFDGKYPENMKIIHGNALCVSLKGESLVGFDRIYIGACVAKANLNKITKLLSPGGVLIGPVDDELVKIVRIGLEKDNEFTKHVLSGVRFAPLLDSPQMETVIPARLWSPHVHHFFPPSFQKASMQVFLCSNSEYNQPLFNQKRNNLAAILPRALWIEILSFTHRKWFEQETTTTEFLKQRLVEEQAVTANAKLAKFEAEARCQIAQRERDVYRLLARRWQSKLQLFLQQQVILQEDMQDDDARMYFSAQESSIEDDFMDQESDDDFDFHDSSDTAAASIEQVERDTMEEVYSEEEIHSKNQITGQIRTVTMGSSDENVI